MKLESFIWIRIDLTFVNALVFVRDRLDNEKPFAGVEFMEHLESVVGDVHKLPNGNQTRISVSNPGHLQKYNNVLINLCMYGSSYRSYTLNSEPNTIST